ncbi:MAG: RES family NAD+ phosphorylase [Myxococcota bacterium]
MRSWRLCKEIRAATAFTGDGARIFGGRWNEPGTPMVYTAENRALAALEQLVHLHQNELPPRFVCFAVDIPDDLTMSRIRPEELDRGWRSYPGPPALQRIGSRWVEEGRTAALIVPSVVVPGEHNILLNPAHRDFSRLVITGPERFELDHRLF